MCGSVQISGTSIRYTFSMINFCYNCYITKSHSTHCYYEYSTPKHTNITDKQKELKKNKERYETIQVMNDNNW